MKTVRDGEISVDSDRLRVVKTVRDGAISGDSDRLRLVKMSGLGFRERSEECMG